MLPSSSSNIEISIEFYDSYVVYWFFLVSQESTDVDCPSHPYC